MSLYNISPNKALLVHVKKIICCMAFENDEKRETRLADVSFKTATVDEVPFILLLLSTRGRRILLPNVEDILLIEKDV